MTTLRDFNGFPPEAAEELLLRCCASPLWAREVAARRPCTDLEQLLAAAHTAWAATPAVERRLALEAHPAIGDVEALRIRYGDAEKTEQGQVVGADAATLRALAELNAAYRARHGFTFIICASGKSAAAMLEALRVRIGRDTAAELATAADEQAAITALRLRRMFGAADG